MAFASTFIPDKTYLQKQDRLSFGGFSLPWDDISIKGTFRRHTHEYRHMPRGSNEKHGRRFYDFTFQIPLDELMDANLIQGKYPGFPGLFATTLPAVRNMYENGQTDSLVVPTWGKMQAFIVEFEQKINPQIQSGKRMTLTFIEDNDVAENYTGVAFAANVDTLKNAASTLIALGVNAGLPIDVFALISSLVSAINTVADTIQFAEQFVIGKAQELVAECQQLNRDLKIFQDPLNSAMLEQLKEVWISAQEIAKPTHATSLTPNKSTVNTLKTSPNLVANTSQTSFNALSIYVTKQLMTVQQLSAAIYGTTDHALDLLSLNYFDDVLNIPQGTQVKYLLS